MQQQQMMYSVEQGQQPQQPPQGTDAAAQQSTSTDAAIQQQQAYVGYPQGMFPAQMQMPFFGQAQPGMADQRPYGMDYSAMMAQYPTAQGDPQDYMNANQFLLARLQQSGQWMPMGYGMPTEGYDPLGTAWSTTSAGLLGKLGGPEPKKKNARKKHKDKPKRPLSAYNLFFKDERKKILAAIPTKTEDGEDKEEELDEEGKKRKKAPHGKIGFENLAKIIGQRWQKLEPDRIEHYKKLAAVDMKRYKEQMEVFLSKIDEDKKKKFVATHGTGTSGETTEGDKEDEEGGEPAAKKLKTEKDEDADNAEEAAV
jgi:hypothetical protein